MRAKTSHSNKHFQLRKISFNGINSVLYSQALKKEENNTIGNKSNFFFIFLASHLLDTYLI